MKKYITLAALLAAGAAFANADITVWEETSGSKSLSASGTSVRSWNVASSGLTWTSGVAESVVFTVDYSSIDSSKSYALFSVKDKTYNGLTGVAISGGNIIFENWNDASPTETSALSDISTAPKDLTFVFSRDPSNNETLAVYADGDFTKTAANLTGKTNQSFRGITWSLLNFGGTTENSYFENVNRVMPSNDNASEFTLLGAGYSVREVANTNTLNAYYAAAIPEPSAFGLLAGLGALALVGARRRRR